MKYECQGSEHIDNSNSSHLKKMAWSLPLPLTHGIASQDCALFINYPTQSFKEEMSSWKHSLILSDPIDFVSLDVSQKLFL